VHSEYLTERVIYGTPYLGLGLGAQSLSHHTLAYNSGAADKRLEHYRRQVQAGELPIQDLYHLSLPAAMGKMISVSFYFGEVHLPAFEARFGLSLERAFPTETAFLLARGLMKYTYAVSGEPLTLRLTEAGVRLYNG
jgi:oxygen-independent coproporphyrinogen-3 oxidase